MWKDAAALAQDVVGVEFGAVNCAVETKICLDWYARPARATRVGYSSWSRRNPIVTRHARSLRQVRRVQSVP